MFIRHYFKQEAGRPTAYWALVESHRTANGPRQRAVAWLGKLDEAGRLGVHQAVDVARKSIEPISETEYMQPLGRQLRFEFNEDQSVVQPRWVEVNAGGVRVENLRQFGGPWLALHLIRVNGGEKRWRLVGGGGRLNCAAPKCSVVDFVIAWKSVIMAGFRVKNPEETSDTGVHRHGNLGGSTPSRFDGRVEQTSGLS